MSDPELATSIAADLAAAHKSVAYRPAEAVEHMGRALLGLHAALTTALGELGALRRRLRSDDRQYRTVLGYLDALTPTARAAELGRMRRATGDGMPLPATGRGRQSIFDPVNVSVVAHGDAGASGSIPVSVDQEGEGEDEDASAGRN